MRTNQFYKRCNMRFIQLLIILTMFNSILSGQDGIEPVEIVRTGQSGWQFLKIHSDPRQAAMGSVLLVNNQASSNAAFGGPALLTQTAGIDIQFNSMTWLADIKHTSAAISKDFGNIGTFALSYISLDYGQVDETIHEEGQGGTTTPVFTGNTFTGGDIAIGLSYARSITDRLALGGTVRYINEEIAGLGMSNWAIDFSTLYYTGLRSLRLAIVAKNFGPDTHLVGYSEELRSEPVDIRMPLEVRAGVAYDFFRKDQDQDQDFLTLVLEGKVQSDGAEKINLGAEYVFHGMLYLRSGYKFNYDEEGLTLGLGIDYPFGKYTLSMNYAYIDFGILTQVNMFSFGLTF